MLHKESNTERLDAELFKNPTAEYRGAPFWAWNDDLDKDELLRQIEILNKMGFGGYHMHTRAGMSTPYLSDSFMELISACVEKGKDMGMLPRLYDEDRWSSGSAGGMVTCEKKMRQKYLMFTKNADSEITAVSAYISNRSYEAPPEKIADGTVIENGENYLLAVYDIEFNERREILSVTPTFPDSEPVGERWYAYVKMPNPSGWYNGQTYVDVLSPEAIKKFIDITYTAYEKTVGKDFGKSVASMFTDEPHFHFITPLPSAFFGETALFAWTTDFYKTFYEAYGFDLVLHLPELVFELKDSAPSRARYFYRDHVCQRFSDAYARQCGEWCREHNLSFTGHMVKEPTLVSQGDSNGEVMRIYQHFDIPGIDILYNAREYTTAKQAQSAVHQYGRKEMMSELYGVCGYDFDFRDFKEQGDWQAALGVTLRVPHLSWYSMRGSAKRDYPASINYQSSWWEKFSLIEDHYARINTALTRGTPSVNVGVIHPIESYWLASGPIDETGKMRVSLNKSFKDITEWLLLGLIDFDFISESTMPQLYVADGSARLKIGHSSYSAVVVPPLISLRSSTVKILTEFAKRGGKVIFTAEMPKIVDAEYSDAVSELWSLSQKSPFSQSAILNALADEREVDVINEYGESAELVHAIRNDGDGKWVFFARTNNKDHGRLPKNRPTPCKITVKGEWDVTVYNTENGEIYPWHSEIRNGDTLVNYVLSKHESLLLRLDPRGDGSADRKYSIVERPVRALDFKGTVEYTLSEPNVLVLDIARYSLDGEEYEDIEELLRIDKALRERLGYPLANGEDVQPWVIGEVKPSHYPYLEFTFDSEIECDCRLGAEGVSYISLNGEEIPVEPDGGYFTDIHIKTYRMPKIRQGRNTLTVRVPFGKRTSIENIFLLGNFGVSVRGAKAKIVRREADVAFGSLLSQGFPFYGGCVTYKLGFTSDGEHDVRIHASDYRGALISVRLDGKEAGSIIRAPYTLDLGVLEAGEHTAELSLYLSRNNSFGALHNLSCLTWKGPSYWYTEGDAFAYEYQLAETGILKSPVIEFYKA